jgi:hypothetical protein
MSAACVYLSFHLSLSLSLSFSPFSYPSCNSARHRRLHKSVRSSKNFNPPASDTLLVTYIFCEKAKNDYKLARARQLASMAITIARRANKYFVRGVKKRAALDLLLPADNNFESPTNPPRPRISLGYPPPRFKLVQNFVRPIFPGYVGTQGTIECINAARCASRTEINGVAIKRALSFSLKRDQDAAAATISQSREYFRSIRRSGRNTIVSVEPH